MGFIKTTNSNRENEIWWLTFVIHSDTLCNTKKKETIMNDNLNLVISYISKDKSLTKVAISIEHGMNLPIGEQFKWFNEPDSFNLIKSYLPMHVVTDVDFIVDVEEIFWITAC